MLLTYQYRAYPNTNQKLALNHWLRICRYWYNWQLGDRFKWWEENRSDYVVPSGEFCIISCSLPPRELRDNPNYYSQKKLLPLFKEDLVKVKHSGELLDFSSVPSQTLQAVSKKVDEAFTRFIKGDKNGKRSGKPRFKNIARYRTLKIEGQAVKLERIERNWLYISVAKLKDWIKIRLHRPLPDGFVLKNILLTKKADGWYISLALEDLCVPQFNSEEIIPTWDNTLGLDAVLHEDDYLATSDGEKLPSLKSFRKSQNKLAKISQRKAKRKRGSRQRRRLAKKEALQHQKIARARSDHAYKTAHALMRTGKKVFVHEDLNLKNLTKKNKAKQDEKGKYLPNGQSAKSGLNKSWLDAAFGNFFTTLEHIAAKAGTRVIAVEPSYTSQYLCYRDEKVFTDCSIREYWDEVEKLLIDRDINTAVNIKRVGLELFLTINRHSGKISKSFTNSTAKQTLETLRLFPEAYTYP
ncbi:RNA-guided endonuclease InsQ/TnpB family protein [Floridanema evergladense]|uniref:RNA-guided endonuclease InsQ/TnpB family protein n=1 Tax=Floridaenema evergladense BLCC-F167 TaxID=3153639 RepID=A0ABV4WKU9_9CYAN